MNREEVALKLISQTREAVKRIIKTLMRREGRPPAERLALAAAACRSHALPLPKQAWKLKEFVAVVPFEDALQSAVLDPGGPETPCHVIWKRHSLVCFEFASGILNDFGWDMIRLTVFPAVCQEKVYEKFRQILDSTQALGHPACSVACKISIVTKRYLVLGSTKAGLLVPPHFLLIKVESRSL